VPAREALGSSLNVPAVKTLQFDTLPSVYAMARRMGLTTLKDISNYGPAFTLGGLDVNLMDMTYAYSSFAGAGDQAGMPTVLKLPEGSRNLDPISVLQVQGSDGHVLWRVNEKHDHVLPPNAAYLITNVLSDDSARVSMFGANSAMNLPGRPAAVKSGSSDDTRDLLAIGYTPQLITGVWVGNADNSPMTGTSSTVAAPIWQAFMTAALKDKPVMQFPIPDGVEFAKVCATTGEVPTSSCPKTVTEVFMSGHLPNGAKTVKPGDQQSAPAPKATAVPQIVAPTPAPVLLPPTPQIPPQLLQPQPSQQVGQPPFPGAPTPITQGPQVQQIPPGVITPLIQPTPRILATPSQPAQPAPPRGFAPGQPGGDFQSNSRPTTY